MNNASNLFSDPEQLEKARFFMIEQQIRPWNVYNHAILESLQRHKRENYVPPQLLELSFIDDCLAIGNDQVMLEPKLQARIVQDSGVQSNEEVLLVGCGTGYMAALLSDFAAHVTCLDIFPQLVEIARQNLAQEKITNVTVEQGDASQTVLDGKQFDVVVLGGSVSFIAPALLAKVKPGGRITGIVGDKPIMRFTIATKTANGTTSQSPWDANAPRLINFAENSQFDF